MPWNRFSYEATNTTSSRFCNEASGELYWSITFGTYAKTPPDRRDVVPLGRGYLECAFVTYLLSQREKMSREECPLSTSMEFQQGRLTVPTRTVEEGKGEDFSQGRSLDNGSR